MLRGWLDQIWIDKNRLLLPPSGEGGYVVDGKYAMRIAPDQILEKAEHPLGDEVGPQ